MNRLEDLREWLMDRIDGSEETRGDDSLISHFIRQIDALDDQVRSLTQPKTIAEWQAAKASPSAIVAHSKTQAKRLKEQGANVLPSATAEPVAWMYEENGLRMFGHPDGYRPKDAVPLYAAPVEKWRLK